MRKCDGTCDTCQCEIWDSDYIEDDEDFDDTEDDEILPYDVWKAEQGEVEDQLK
jgi:hypothetical protein